MLEASGSEFLRALHEEKIRTQTERAGYITQKLTFVTILLGLSVVNMRLAIVDFYWLLYFIPMLVICYDLFFMSADSRVKRIGIFLGRHPSSQASEAEKQWEAFCKSYQDSIISLANMFFSIFITVGAAAFIHSQQSADIKKLNILFAAWLMISLLIIVVLWFWHHKVIGRMCFKAKPRDFNSH